MRLIVQSLRESGGRNLRWLLGLIIVLGGGLLVVQHLMLLARLSLSPPLYLA
ncbi:hypothetical protein RZ740_005014, partial [Escherichia coli]|nr:hypothetical protein [Escherichia coli]